MTKPKNPPAAASSSTSTTATATPPAPLGNTGHPAGNAPTAAEAADAAKEAAQARGAAAAGEVRTAKAAEKLAARPPVGLGPRPTHDVVGRKLPAGGTPESDQQRRLQQRDATVERQRRIDEDTDRVNHGLAPKWATSGLED